MPKLIGNKYYTLVTDIGEAKIANSLYSGKKIDFAVLKLGNGDGEAYNPDSSQTDLRKEVWRGNVVHVEIDEKNSNWINIYTVIPPGDGGFWIREMGVFDSEGDMIAICNVAPSYKPTLDEGSAKEITMKMTMAVTNTSVITLKVDPTVIYAKRKDVLTLTTKVNDITAQLNDLTQDSYPIVEATGTNTYVGASARIKSVGKGTRCTLFVGTASNGNCSLNLNNSGAVAIKDSNGNVVTNLKANIPYNLCHNGSAFILQGKGGGGNLIPKYLLAGYYGEGDNGRVDGAMVNRGAPTANLNCGGTYNLQEGYYSGGKVTANSLATQMANNGVTLTSASQLISNVKAISKTGQLLIGTATPKSIGGSDYKKVVLTSGFTIDDTYSTRYLYVNLSSVLPSDFKYVKGKIVAGTDSFNFILSRLQEDLDSYTYTEGDTLIEYWHGNHNSRANDKYVCERVYLDFSKVLCMKEHNSVVTASKTLTLYIWSF